MMLEKNYNEKDLFLFESILFRSITNESFPEYYLSSIDLDKIYTKIFDKNLGLLNFFIKEKEININDYIYESDFLGRLKNDGVLSNFKYFSAPDIELINLDIQKLFLIYVELRNTFPKTNNRYLKNNIDELNKIYFYSPILIGKLETFLVSQLNIEKRVLINFHKEISGKIADFKNIYLDFLKENISFLGDSQDYFKKLLFKIKDYYYLKINDNNNILVEFNVLLSEFKTETIDLKFGNFHYTYNKYKDKNASCVIEGYGDIDSLIKEGTKPKESVKDDSNYRKKSIDTVRILYAILKYIDSNGNLFEDEINIEIPREKFVDLFNDCKWRDGVNMKNDINIHNRMTRCQNTINKTLKGKISFSIFIEDMLDDKIKGEGRKMKENFSFRLLLNKSH